MSWNVIFWILFLFATINTLVRTSQSEMGKRNLYYYQIVHPIEFVLAKIFYNTILVFLIAILQLYCLQILIFDPVQDLPLFLLVLALASFGFATIFTFIATLVTNSFRSGFIAILATPLILPILLSCVKISAQALGFLDDDSLYQDIISVAAIETIVFGLVILLFPTIWKS